MNIIWSEDFPASEFAVGLTQDEIFEAASIGLHDAVGDHPDDLLDEMKRSPNVARLVAMLARHGLKIALEEAQGRRFPARYPDDFADADLSNVITFPPRG
jgi:hypothetical protein